AGTEGGPEPLVRIRQPRRDDGELLPVPPARRAVPFLRREPRRAPSGRGRHRPLGLVTGRRAGGDPARRGAGRWAGPLDPPRLAPRPAGATGAAAGRLAVPVAGRYPRRGRAAARSR